MTGVTCNRPETVRRRLANLISCILLMLSVLAATPAHGDDPPRRLAEGDVSFSRIGTYYVRVSRTDLPDDQLRLAVYRAEEQLAKRLKVYAALSRDRLTQVRFAGRYLLQTVSPDLKGAKQWETVIPDPGATPQFHLSDDGRSLVLLFDWPVRSGALFFYREGRGIRHYRDIELPFDRDLLVRTVSHYFWALRPEHFDELWAKARFSRRFLSATDVNASLLRGITKDNGTFYVTTVDGHRHEFSLRTGAHLRSKQWITTDEFEHAVRNPEASEITHDEKLFIFLDRMHHEDSQMRARAAAALRDLADRRAVEHLIAALKDGDEGVRSTSAEALGWMGDKRALGPLGAAAEREAVEWVLEAIESAIERLEAP